MYARFTEQTQAFGFKYNFLQIWTIMNHVLRKTCYISSKYYFLNNPTTLEPPEL